MNDELTSASEEVIPEEGPLPTPLPGLPLPPVVWVLAIVTVLAVACAAIRMPESFRLAIKHERGMRLLAEGKANEAVAELGPVHSRYPGCHVVAIDLFGAYIQAGRSDDADRLKDEMKDMAFDADEVDRLKQLAGDSVKLEDAPAEGAQQ